MTIDDRVQAIFRAQLQRGREQTDTLFVWLLLVQWVGAIVLALTLTPYTWVGSMRAIHPHVWQAIVAGGLLNLVPISMIYVAPGSTMTRHTVAVAQMCWSALLITLSGGRIETHFHIFGSLAFLAFYRDWRVVLTASVVTALDHLLRGLYWPESIYGTLNPEWWRFAEHAGWVVFEDVVLIMSCQRGLSELRAIALRGAHLEALNQSIERQVVAKTEELSTSVERYRALIECTSAVPWEIDPRTMCLTYVAPQSEKVFGIPAASVVGDPRAFRRVLPEDRAKILETVNALRGKPLGTEAQIEYQVRNDVGEVRHVRSSVTFTRASASESVHLFGIAVDVTAQKQLELELRQAQKLESVGRLAAGVAHEINTPIQYVSDNVEFLRTATGRLFGLLDRHREVARRAITREDDGAVAALEEAERKARLPYLSENVPAAIDAALEGLQRVSEIVRSMKAFAHPDQGEMAAIDLNQAIRNTLTVARNEYKYVADLDLDLGDLPPVTCLSGEINQVVLNLVVNAAHAIGDVVGDSGNRGTITVRTRVEGDHVIITIGDTGGGIPEAIRHRLFDPFFTTKAVGKGTGQGLAIARAVVVDKHGGRLSFETDVGKGTTFFVALPTAGVPQAVVEAAA